MLIIIISTIFYRNKERTCNQIDINVYKIEDRSKWNEWMSYK